MKTINWPYPRWIAHRGAGLHAPENTMAAFRYGLQAGYRMFECDAKLTQDHEIILLHDATLDRTTDGHGYVNEVSWHDVQKLDAGRWHSALYAGEAVASLARLMSFCQANDCMLNIEIKPVPGLDELTGTTVARVVSQAWQDSKVKPLLSSFSIRALQAAHATAPELPRGQLMHEWHPHWRAIVTDLECSALICHHPLITEHLVGDIHQSGLKCLAYTVNDSQEVDRLLRLGVDGIITDEVNQFDPRRLA